MDKRDGKKRLFKCKVETETKKQTLSNMIQSYYEEITNNKNKDMFRYVG